MQVLGSAFVLAGILVMGLSGLEKVIVFTALGKTSDMQAVINLTPPYIWNLTNTTFWFGLLFFVLGAAIFVLQLRSRSRDVL